VERSSAAGGCAIGSGSVATIEVPEAAGYGEFMRRDKRYIGTGSTSGSGGILQSGLDESATFTIQSAATCLQVSYGRDEGPVNRKGAARRENISIRQQHWRSPTTVVSEGYSVTLRLYTDKLNDSDDDGSK